MLFKFRINKALCKLYLTKAIKKRVCRELILCTLFRLFHYDLGDPPDQNSAFPTVLG